jgi:hypothetical protein
MGYFERAVISNGYLESRDLQNNQKGLGLIILQHDILLIRVTLI